jgi:hypothetical protein
MFTRQFTFMAWPTERSNMSLNWDLKGIENYEELCWVPLTAYDHTTGEYDADAKKKLNPVTNALIWATMSIGMGDITKKNWEKFADRIALLQGAKASGLLTFGLGEYYVSREEVKQHMGLSTNVFPETTDSAFMKVLYGVARDNERRNLKITEATKVALAKYRADKAAEVGV